MSNELNKGSKGLGAEAPAPRPAVQASERPLADRKALLVRWRWLFTLAVPLCVAWAVMNCFEPGPLAHRLMDVLCHAGFALWFSTFAVKGWRLKSRIGQGAEARP